MSAELGRSSISVAPNPIRKFSERLAALSARIECRAANTEQEREAIFRLRYQAYLREDAISANPTERFTDADDNDDNAYLLGFYIDDELASSLRLHIGSKEHPAFPSLEVFPEVLQPRLDADRVLVDSTRFVADEKLSRLHRGLPYATLRACVLAAEYFHADDLLAAVRAEHQAFYRRAFSHQVLCEPRPYPQLAKPISLMSVDFPTVREGWYRKYPFFHSSGFERRKLFERPSSAGAEASLQPANTSGTILSRGTSRPFVDAAAA